MVWGAIAQWLEYLWPKQETETLGSIPSGCPRIFLFQMVYTNVDGMKDLWCSSTVSAAINTDVNECGALVQFGCCQHRMFMPHP